TTEIYTLSLHDALPIFKNYLLDIKNSGISLQGDVPYGNSDKFQVKKIRTMPPLNRKEKLYSSLIAIVLLAVIWSQMPLNNNILLDRKSTRLNSSHVSIS